MSSPQSPSVAPSEVDLFYRAQLGGCLVPFRDDRPLFVVAGRDERIFLPVFSSLRWLDHFVYVRLGATYDRVGVVRNCRELVDQVHAIGVEFAFNPTWSQAGACSFREIRRFPTPGGPHAQA